MTHDPVPHADRDHSEQPSLTGDRKAATGFRCCVHCKDDVAYHEDNSPDSHDTECTLCTQALALRDAQQRATPSMAMAGSDPTQGTSHPGSAREVRASEAQVEAARLAWHRQARAVADAVVAAGPDADEVTRLRAELKRLGIEVAKVARERSAAEDRAESWEQVADDYNAEIVAAHAERERLAEVVARVEALLEVWEADGPQPAALPVENLRAALSGPTPAHTPEVSDERSGK